MKRVPGSIPNMITGLFTRFTFTEVQPNKTIKIFINYFLAPLLFAWLLFSIYHNIKSQPQLLSSWEAIKSSFNSANILLLIGALILIPVNWGLESLKWKLAVATVSPISFKTAFKAVLAGVTFSVSMPNRIGEYLGRVLYLPEGSRLRTISVTLVASMAQLLITLACGLAGMIALKSELTTAFPKFFLAYQIGLYALGGLLLFLLLFYFNVSSTVRLFQRWMINRKALYLVVSLKKFDTPLLSQLLIFSLLRYMVFLIQYALIFKLFGVDLALNVTAPVLSVIFLGLTIIPSIALLEIGIRGEISLLLVGIFSANSLGISLSSVTIWFMNLILPAIAGTIALFSLRAFKKKSLRAQKEESLQKP